MWAASAQILHPKDLLLTNNYYSSSFVLCKIKKEDKVLAFGKSGEEGGLTQLKSIQKMIDNRDQWFRQNCKNA